MLDELFIFLNRKKEVVAAGSAYSREEGRAQFRRDRSKGTIAVAEGGGGGTVFGPVNYGPP